MKFYTILFCIGAVYMGCQSKNESTHQHAKDASPAIADIDTLKKSIPKEAHAQIGSAHLTIKYHAPAVRDRTIWGGLVPYDEVWVTGAHNATSLEVNESLRIDGKIVPPGKYALFTIPGRNTWTIIINKNWDQHLADQYDSAEDVLRVSVTPEVQEHVQERLNYSIQPSGKKSGVIEIAWEKLNIKLPFRTDGE